MRIKICMHACIYVCMFVRVYLFIIYYLKYKSSECAAEFLRPLI